MTETGNCDKIKMVMCMNIILASASPRRRELMKLITDDFIAVSVDADETLPEDPGVEGIEDAAEYLAEVKAAKAHELYPDDLVIGCDTIVVCNGKILGKPKDKAQARDYLHMLSDNCHTVYTGCCIRYKEKKYSFSVSTVVFFNRLTDEEIEEYISTDEPYDKAGGYGIQSKGALFADMISGDFYNVVGLPVSRLNQILKKIMKENDLI